MAERADEGGATTAGTRCRVARKAGAASKPPGGVLATGAPQSAPVLQGWPVSRKVASSLQQSGTAPGPASSAIAPDAITMPSIGHGSTGAAQDHAPCRGRDRQISSVTSQRMGCILGFSSEISGMSHQAPRRGASAAKSFAARVYPEKDRWMEASGSLTPISGDQTPSSAISTLDLEM